MAFINYFSLEHLLNLTLFGVVFLVWLILNRWINKSLEGYLKQKGWLVAGREKNNKKHIWKKGGWRFRFSSRLLDSQAVWLYMQEASKKSKQTKTDKKNIHIIFFGRGLLSTRPSIIPIVPV